MSKGPERSPAQSADLERARNGREYGKWAMEDFTEVKAIIGYDAA